MTRFIAWQRSMKYWPLVSRRVYNYQALSIIEYTTCSIRPPTTGDPVAWCVGQSVCLSVARLRCAKTAKQIEMLFWVETLVDPKDIALGDLPIPLQRGGWQWWKFTLIVKFTGTLLFRFDAAFAKLLWLLVTNISCQFQRYIYCSNYWPAWTTFPPRSIVYKDY